MDVICYSCKSKLNIPDDKVPEDQRVSVSCPKCRAKMAVGRKEKSPEQGSAQHLRSGEDYEPGEDENLLGLYEEGARLALVMEDDPKEAEKIKRAIERLGYKYVSAQNTRQAIGKMRFHQFDLVILSERFDGVEPSQSPVLHYLNNLSMSLRRKIFVALIGDAFVTMDHLMAFAMSANLVINRKDLDKLMAILKRAVADNEQFYKVLMDTIKEVGKA